MNYGYYFIISLFLIILDTALIPTVPFSAMFYDLLIPFVVYIGLFRPLKEGVAVVLVLGLVVDGLSSGPFGLFLTTYLWLFAGVKWIVTFLHAHSKVILPFVVALGVLLENAVFFGVVGILMPAAQFPLDTHKTILVQFVLAVFTGPVCLLLVEAGHKKWWALIGQQIRESSG